MMIRNGVYLTVMKPAGRLGCARQTQTAWRKEAINIYDHIDKKKLKESYLAHIPQLGV